MKSKTNPTNPLAPAQDVEFICSIVEDIGEVCDGALTQDGVGFNKPDQIFVDLVRRYPRERWTAADVASAAANLLKYHGQMSAASHKRLKVTWSYTRKLFLQKFSNFFCFRGTLEYDDI